MNHINKRRDFVKLLAVAGLSLYLPSCTSDDRKNPSNLKDNKSKDPVHLDRLDYSVSRYYKHVNDIMFYKHTIKSAKDYNVVISTGARLQESIYALKETKENLILF